MLAEKLVAKTDFDCSRELRTMELLKLRFGDSNMHDAEIMLAVSAFKCFTGLCSARWCRLQADAQDRCAHSCPCRPLL